MGFPGVQGQASISGQTTEPVVFDIGDKQYTLVIEPHPLRGPNGKILRDEFGEPEVTHIDWDQHLLIVSTKCQGRVFVNASLGLYLTACRHEEGQENYPYDDLTVVTSLLERFLLETGSEPAILQRLQPSNQPKRRLPIPRPRLIPTLYAVAAASFALAFLIPFITHSNHPPRPAALVNSPSLNLADTLSLTRYPFTDVDRVIAHPNRREWFTASNQGTISRHPAGDIPKTLGQTPTPTRSLHFDALRQQLLATDWTAQLHILPLDLQKLSRQLPLEQSASRAFPSSRRDVIWLGYDANIFDRPIDETESSTLIGNAHHAVPAHTRPDAYALATTTAIHVHFGDERTRFDRRTVDGQHLNALDIAANAPVAVLAFADGTLETYQQHPTADRFDSQTLKLPDDDRATLVCVTANGRHAYAVGQNLYRIDLLTNRITATLELGPITKSPILALAVQNQERRILLATRYEGLLWQAD